MEILGIGPLEALFILILALVFVGPRDLSKHARTLGRALNRLYRSEAWHAVAEASRNLRSLPNRLAREAALAELDQAQTEIKDVSRRIQDDLREVGNAVGSAGPPDREQHPEADGSTDEGDRTPSGP